MDNTEIVLWSAAGTVVMLLLIIAAYLHGQHNGKHLAGIKQKDGTQPIDPGFVLETIEDGVIIVDSKGVIRLFNPAARHIAGWQADEAVGLDYRSVLSLVDEHGVGYDPNKLPISVTLATGQTIRDNKASLVTRDGNQIATSFIVSPIKAELGGGAIGVFRDVSREKAEENAKAEFISTASHEMRTPIASIEGYLSLALNNKTGEIDSESRIYLEKAHKATQHLGQLFKDLLTTTRAEDSQLSSRPQPVEVGQVISEVVNEERSNAEKKKLSLHYQTSGSASSGAKIVRPLFYVSADPLQLKEVFQNLLDNAIKYTTAGGVTIKLTGDSSVVQIQVTDSGAGIPGEDIPHLFQKFYRVDNSLTREVGGTGLGLFICRKILELYNGRIWVESRLGKGSTFYVNLPRIDTGKAIAGQSQSTVVQSKQTISV